MRAATFTLHIAAPCYSSQPICSWYIGYSNIEALPMTKRLCFLNAQILARTSAIVIRFDGLNLGLRSFREGVAYDGVGRSRLNVKMDLVFTMDEL